MRLFTSVGIVSAMLLSSGLWSDSHGQDPFGADPFSGDPAQTDPFAQPPAQPNQPRRATTRPKQQPIISQAKKVLQQGRKPVLAARSKQHTAEQRINAALDDQTTQTFIETPLVEAIQVISRSHNIPIVIDRRALEEIGLSSDVGVSIDLRNVTLRSYLRLMLRDLDLTYLVKDEVMQITTAEAAEQNLVIEIYEMPGRLATRTDQVAKVIPQMVVPDAWDITGGPSTLAAFDHLLVVSATSDVQQRVKEFIGMLGERYGQ